jgi:hypothetical protein
MSRKRSVAPDATEIANLQAEIALRNSQLSESSRRYEDMRQRYEGLLRILSQPGNDAASSNSDLHELSMPYAADETADLEIQQWNLMWTHLISMTTQVIEYGEISAKSGSEKRTVLVDIVGKLCEAASAPKNTEAFATLQKKYQRSKQALRKLKAQGEALLQEVERNKAILETHLSEFSVRDETKLAHQIRQLQTLLKKQLVSQTEFLRNEGSERFEVKPLSPRRKSLPVDDDTIIRPIRSPIFRKPEKVVGPRNEEEETEELPPPASKSAVLDVSSSRFSASRQRREVAEKEADEVLMRQKPNPSPPKRKQKPQRKPLETSRRANCGDVDQLVDLTNQLRDDYRRLGRYFGAGAGGADLSIEQLSKLNDSLFSAERDIVSD